MKLLKPLVLLIFGMALFMLGHWSGSGGNLRAVPLLSPHSDAGSGEFRIADRDLNATIAAANAGDIGAMQKLFNHYQFSSLDPDKAKEWSLRLAEAGDSFEQQSILKEYLNSNDPKVRARGAAVCHSWLMKPKLAVVR